MKRLVTTLTQMIHDLTWTVAFWLVIITITVYLFIFLTTVESIRQQAITLHEQEEKVCLVVQADKKTKKVWLGTCWIWLWTSEPQFETYLSVSKQQPFFCGTFKNQLYLHKITFYFACDVFIWNAWKLKLFCLLQTTYNKATISCWIPNRNSSKQNEIMQTILSVTITFQAIWINTIIAWRLLLLFWTKDKFGNVWRSFSGKESKRRSEN